MGSDPLGWSSVISGVSELNGIRDYREHLQAQGSFTDDMRMETSMQNIASIDYLEQLVTSGTLMDMVDSMNTRNDTLHNNAFSSQSYEPLMSLGDWGKQMTGLPYTLESRLTDWTTVYPTLHEYEYRVEPGDKLSLYWMSYQNTTKSSKYRSRNWKWQ